ncbi:MAG: PilW family protein [Pseudomonadota bacterium]
MSAPPRRQAGFSIVELMVSVVISLLALSLAVRLYVSSEQNKQSSLGSSDTMQNGMVALFSLNRDASQAGWGLNDPLVAGCDTLFSDGHGFSLAKSKRDNAEIKPLAPVVIEVGKDVANKGAESDKITFYAGSAIGGTGSLRLTLDYGGEGTLSVDRFPYGFARGDAILVAPESIVAPVPKCTIGQISSDPSVQAVVGVNTIDIAGGPANRYNGAGGLGANYTNGTARVFNLGPADALSFHTWTTKNGFLTLQATDLGSDSKKEQTVLDNIVAVKAQYGFDTSAVFDPEVGMNVTQWSAEMVDADKDTVTGGPGDWQRIAAVRLAVVARSKMPDKPAADGSCSATTAMPQVFTKAEPSGVVAVPITVKVDIAGDPIDWTCYRYRVFETVVAMRNAAWRPRAQ